MYAYQWKKGTQRRVKSEGRWSCLERRQLLGLSRSFPLGRFRMFLVILVETKPSRNGGRGCPSCHFLGDDASCSWIRLEPSCRIRLGMLTSQTLLVTCSVHHLLISENQKWTSHPVFCHCCIAQKTLCRTCLHLLPENHYWRSQFLDPFLNPECCVPNCGRSVRWCTLCHKWSVEGCTHLHCSPLCHPLFSNNKGSAVSSQVDLMAFPLC